MKSLFAVLSLALLASCQTSTSSSEETYEVRCFGRHAPERQDDFTWENDKVAYRMYGPECGKAGGVLSGIDVWAKKVDKSIIDLWYARNDKGMDYHTDRGEGADFYKVGRTLGAGGLGFLEAGKLHCTEYWTKSRILEQGPDRIVFELDFPDLKVGKATVTETKKITLERGSNLNKIECRFKISGADSVQAAAGIRKSDKKGDTFANIENGIAYSEVVDKKQVIYSAVLMSNRSYEYTEAHDHHLLKTTVKDGETLTYYAGSGWMQSGQFKSFEAWQAYLNKNF